MLWREIECNNETYTETFHLAVFKLSYLILYVGGFPGI